MVVVGLQNGTLTTFTYDSTGLRRKSQAGAARGGRGRVALALASALVLAAGCRLGGATAAAARIALPAGLVAIAGPEADARLALVDRDGQVVDVPEPKGVVGFALSHDGRRVIVEAVSTAYLFGHPVSSWQAWLADLGERGLTNLRLLPRPPQALWPSVPVVGEPEEWCQEAAWSPDDRQLAVIFEQRIWTLDLATGRFHRLYLSGPLARGADCPDRVCWSPDGRWIGFRVMSQGVQLMFPRIMLVRPDGSGLRRVEGLAGSLAEEWPVWTPDGARMAFECLMPDGRLQAAIEDMATAKARRVGPPGANEGLAWSPDGQTLAIPTTKFGETRPLGQGSLRGESRIVAVDTRTGKVTALTPETQGIECFPTWSPDGRSLAFARQTAGCWQVVVHELASGKETAMRGPGREDMRNPAWQPAGN